MEDKNFIFSEFQHISNKLKKRRILKKPNVAEACQQFENLAVTCENDELPQYAGLCYQAAANCQNSLGNNSEQAHLLLRAYRQYLLNYSKYVSNGLVFTDENLHEALVCYKECLECYANNQDENSPNSKILMANITMEMADTFWKKLGLVERAVNEYKNALKMLNDSPFEKINCLQKLISAKIELGDYDETFKYTNELVEETQRMPASGFKEDILQCSEITRILILLILQPTPQQITPLADSILEKYAWIETVDNNEMADLQTTRSSNDMTVINEKLFICLQSLVMACQYGDLECLDTLESELLPFLNCEQKDLLRTLIKRKQKN